VRAEARDWTEELGSADTQVQAAALAALRAYLRGALAKGFARQLSDTDLDEVTQEAVVRVHNKKDTFNGQSKFTTWAAAIAVNVALGELRRRRHKHVSLEDAAASGRALIEPAAAPEALRHGELMRALSKGIDTSLTERQRVALQAKLSGMPMSEIARRERMTPGALYKLLYDGRKRLLGSLQAQGFSRSDLAAMDTGIEP